MPPSVKNNLPDIQGNVVRGYRMPLAAYLHYRFHDARQARAWLGAINRHITNGAVWNGQKPPFAVNIALTYHGLSALGVARSALGSFPEEFVAGMAGSAETLGDHGESAPDRWEPPFGTSSVHALVLVNALSDEHLREAVGLIDAETNANASVELVHAQQAGRLRASDGTPLNTEHFGYIDGIAQPDIEGSGFPSRNGQGTPTADGRWQPIKAGEFLFGYDAENGFPPPAPSPPALSKNGTFLVYRKLRQDVAGFRRLLRSAALVAYRSDTEEFRKRVAAKFGGRWPDSGCPVVLSPDHDNPQLADDPDRINDFRYNNDPAGRDCPLGAHIRRMNPRDMLDSTDILVKRHRIIRRGLPYGTWLESDDDDGRDRGIIFMAINTSFSRQFEFIQRNWANDGSFANLGSQKDVVAGDSGGLFSIPGAPTSIVNTMKRYVVMRGGEYFFMPGIAALHGLAAGDFA